MTINNSNISFDKPNLKSTSEDTARYLNNIEVLKNLKHNPQPELLKSYTGWGGLREAIYTPTIYKQLLQVLTREEIVSLKQTLTSAYYTPAEIVTFMYQWLMEHSFIGGSILEPAIGNGVFIEHMPQLIKQNSTVTAVELDQVTSKSTQNLYPEIKLNTCGFEEYNPTEQYDLIIGNPPYGANRVIDQSHLDLKDYCIHHYFVAKSMRLLKKDGILAMVLPSYFLDNRVKHTRDIIKKEGGNLIDAYRLPDNLFQGAKITIDIVFLKKGNTGNNWLYTRKTKVKNHLMPINEFYIQHPKKILGDLDVVDMYERKGLTCSRNTNKVFELLHSKLKNHNTVKNQDIPIKKLKKLLQELQEIIISLPD